jgi:ribonuclease HI
MESYAARPDLTDQPLDISDLVYTDGSSFVKDRTRHVGFTVVTEFGTLQLGPLLPNTNAQLAELMALTKALELSKDNKVNIYTDSNYAFLILHAAIWKERGMLTTTGSQLSVHRTHLHTVLLPNQVSVFYCPGHQKGDDEVAKGNRAADETATKEFVVVPLLWRTSLRPPEKPHY